jgi:PAS domain S-box-containing protein
MLTKQAIRRSPWFLVLGLFLCVLILPAIAEQPVTKNVLILHNWNGLPQSWALMESTVRSRVPGQINFYTASVENQRFYEESFRESLAETLHRGYSGVKLDVVVAASYPVLQFLMQYRDQMFPGVPVVFTDVGMPEAEIKWPDVTGVISPVAVKETIDLALHLNPDTTSVAVITGISEYDKFWLAVAHAELLSHQDQLKEIDLIGPAESQTILKVAELPPHSVVLFLLRPDDLAQPAVDPLATLAAVAQLRPTYSAWRGLSLERGGVGGVFRNLPKDAELNGEVVARVLSGEAPKNIPIVRDTELQTHVDWRALQHWHIPESALPANTVIENRPLTFWQLYRKYILIAIAVFIAQALLIAGLLWQRARKCKAEAILAESEERFRTMADTIPSLVWMCDPGGRITYLNGRRISFTGTDPDAGYGDSWVKHVHPDDVAHVLETFYDALKTKQSFSQEYRLRRSDGAYRWMFDVASPRVNGDGSFAGFIGSAIDATDQKLAQQALAKLSGQLIEAQEQERSRIARELHDDICQRLSLLSTEIEQANQASSASLAVKKTNLDRIRERCNEITDDVQSLSHRLHSSTLDILGVVTAIRSFCGDISRKHNVTIDFTESKVPEYLPKDISLCLFRIAQEALHNAVKYSGTDQFSVDLSSTGNQVQLVIQDAGAGFDIQEAKKNQGLGLVSMQERINLVHGSFSIESRPGKGTRIFATVPFVPENESAGEGDAGKTIAACSKPTSVTHTPDTHRRPYTGYIRCL